MSIENNLNMQPPQGRLCQTLRKWKVETKKVRSFGMPRSFTVEPSVATEDHKRYTAGSIIIFLSCLQSQYHYS